MPALPSFINYKAGRKAKAVIRSPFSLLRGEASTSTSTPVPPSPHFFTTEVIDINDRGPKRYSLDFDGGKPIDEYETDIIDRSPRLLRTETTSSPQVQLNIDLSSPEGLTDWFAANFLPSEGAQVPAVGGSGKAAPSGLKKEKAGAGAPEVLNGTESILDMGEDDEGADSSEEVIASLEAMDASHFGKLPVLAVGRLDNLASRRIQSSIRSSDSMTFKSSVSMMDTPISSAVSGTTLARALLSNTFSLANDARSSKYRSGAVGLTRSDSTTLPRGDHIYGSDRFSIGPDAPPIPADAEFLYQPPKKSRLAEEWREKRRQNLKRRSSTGSLHHKALPDTPSATSSRPISALISPSLDIDFNRMFTSPAPLTPPSLPRSPLPLPPTPKPTISIGEDKNPNGVPPLPEGVRRLPDPHTPSPDMSLLSPSPAPSADGNPYSKNVEDVLNYYSIPSPDPLVTGANYRPAFSPITEETSSQLSPPTPYRNDRRDSQRNTPIGARSPLSGRARVDSVTLPRRPSDSAISSKNMLPPLTEGLALVENSSPAESYRSSIASTDSDPFLSLAPPPVNNIFNRARSGSAPTPIKVMHDPKDQKASSLNIIPLTPDGDTPTSETALAGQQLPETPNMFSPLVTGDSEAFGSNFVDALDVAPIPTTPTSAAIPGRGTAQPNLAQQLLLNRAGTTVRHSRHTSVGKIKTTGIGGRSSSPSNRHIINEANESKSSIQENSSSLNRYGSKEDIHYDSPEEQVASSTRPPSAIELTRSSSRGTLATHSDDSSLHTSESTKSKLKSLPAIPVSPFVPGSRSASPATMTPPPSSTTDLAPVVTEINGHVIPPPPTIPPPSPSLSQRERAKGLPARDRARPPPALTLSGADPSVSTVAVNGNDTSPPGSSENHGTAPPLHPSTTVPLADNTLPPNGSLNYKDNGYMGRASDIFRGTSLGSPPPYYSVVNETPTLHNLPSSTSHPIFDGTPLHLGIQIPPPPGPNVSMPGASSSLTEARSSIGRENSITSQRARPRPPLPAGPRRPSQGVLFTHSPSAFHLSMSRDRSGSVSSIASNALQPAAGSSTQRSGPTNTILSPRFQTPPPKWRGYTMETAKWTFTSTQLQDIVSRAIRQSAEASSIRLLRLETLDNEIPEEVTRLQAQRTDLKTRYKVLTRRRATLFDSLSTFLTGAGEDDSSSALRTLDELRELALTLDKIAEELHSVDGQLTHLESLTTVHTASALAMALRKLNASFLKQMAENQMLRTQNQSMQAEREEAWRQAESIAVELDRMNETVDSPTSRRSSQISAFRKSSIRLSKAGLRTPSQRFSQGSSLSGGHYGSAHPSGSKSPSEKIPPVPPIPNRRPFDVLIDSPLLSSAALSASGYTPSSADHALVQAQDELYAMLGLSNPERVLRRSRSMNLPLQSPPATSAGQVTLHPPILHPEFVAASRRSSLPPDSTLAETYNAMTADRNAVLATLEMLSSTDPQ